MQTLSDRGFRLKRPAAVTSAHWGMNTEQVEDQPEGWRTLWLAIVGVMAITLTWNVLMLSLNGISY
jgi:Mg2+ and Co2+ transporter CorA